jgi:hypothetical protein
MGITWRFQQRQHGGQLHFVLIEFTFQVIRMILDFSASLESRNHYQKTGENQQNYRRIYSVGSYYRRTKFHLKICRYIPTEYIRRQYGRYIPTEIFRRYIPTVSPTDYFFRRFYRRNDRGIQTEIAVQ